MPNRENLNGPLIEGNRLSKRLIDFLHRVDDGQQTAATVAAAAQETADSAASASSSISITGQDPIQVYGDSASGYVITSTASSSFVPTFIGEDERFLVPANTQALYHIPIAIDGVLSLDGALVEV